MKREEQTDDENLNAILRDGTHFPFGIDQILNYVLWYGDFFLL